MKNKIIVGIDEAGRGPIAGPVKTILKSPNNVVFGRKNECSL